MGEGATSLTLLDRARGREPEAWRRLVYLYTPLVHHWLAGLGVRGPDADDVRQDVFQAVAAGLGGFRRDRPDDTFRGWLRVIARRKAADFHRSRGRQPEAAGGTDAGRRLAELPDPTPDADPAAEVHGLHRRALELIRDQFEERTWRAFWRCAVDGRSPADVADEMGMTAAGVRQAKSRVLRKLKEDLGDLLG